MAKPRPLIGLMAGVAAGLVASAAMSVFQSAAEALAPEGDDAPAAPPNATAQLVVGAVMGGIYGLLTEYRPEASTGFGSAYGIATATLLDDAAPAPAGDAAPVETQVHGVASHAVFGIVLEGVRRLIGGRR